MLAVFAAGSVVHTVNTASMNTTMALAVIDSGDMGYCQDCPDGSNELQPCDFVCVSPVLAILPSGESGLPAAVTITEKSVYRSLAGRTGLPNPYGSGKNVGGKNLLIVECFLESALSLGI